VINGIENGGMPPVRQTTEKEQNDLIAYVRALGRATTAPPKGNVRRGKDLYVNRECPTCHIINGDGAGVGPDLTFVAQSHGPEYLRQALVDPGAALPRGTSDVSNGFAEFLPVHVVTRDGKETRGMRINEDTFTIQLRDADNHLHSFDKSDLVEFKKELNQSAMPSYRQLTASQLDDLIAYLSDRRGSE
jgi:cytochrome c oxidase cbb3-type subunit III